MMKRGFFEEEKSGRGIIAFVLILLALVLLFSLLAKSCSELAPATVQGKVVTNTVYRKSVERIYVLPDAVFTPEKVTIATEPDTIRRKERESGDIITGVIVGSRIVEVQTIDPRGIVISHEYSIPEGSEVTIDADGRLGVKEDRKKKRKKFWQKAGKIGIGVGSFAIGFLLGK